MGLMRRKKRLQPFKLRFRVVNHQKVLQLACPGCGSWGRLDDEQLNGQRPIPCPFSECNFNEVLDLARNPDVEWVEDE